MIRVGVIGYGYWVRTWCEISWKRQVRQLLSLRFANRAPGPVTDSLSHHTYVSDAYVLFNDPSLDAIVIATPVSSHFELALTALQANKHVLVEKPLAANSEQSIQLMEEAARRERVLMVDHTFVYTGAVRKIRELINSNALATFITTTLCALTWDCFSTM